MSHHIPPAGVPERYETVGKVSEWAEGQVKEIKAHKKPMAIGRRGDVFFAVNTVCPHMGGPLSCGKLAEGKLHCPWHDWAFDIETGLCGNGHRIDRYEIVVDGDEVKVGWVMRD